MILTTGRQLAHWPLQSILYISCNGATLFRDAEILLAAGFTVTKFGLLDMFPQTEHVEMMVLFQRSTSA
jgi:23S rRNA (uracil1939-C5)-methyltransferase